MNSKIFSLEALQRSNGVTPSFTPSFDQLHVFDPNGAAQGQKVCMPFLVTTSGNQWLCPFAELPRRFCRARYRVARVPYMKSY